MSADIISKLQLENQFENGRVMVAKEINGCDSSFISSCILGHSIKNKSPVLLVLIHNSLTHYHNVGLRMYYNLKKSIDCGLIEVYDFAKENTDILLNNNQPSLEKNASNLIDKITQMQEKFGSVHVVIDGISNLLDLQFSVQEVNQFCVQIVKLIWTFENSFVLFHCNVASEDDTTHSIANVLCHMAQIVLEVESLSSGWSADVSGRLKITYNGRKLFHEDMFIMNLEPSLYLFKLFDKGVKLFAPGTV